jgi:hypothetical protein
MQIKIIPPAPLNGRMIHAKNCSTQVYATPPPLKGMTTLAGGKTKHTTKYKKDTIMRYK